MTAIKNGKFDKSLKIFQDAFTLNSYIPDTIRLNPSGQRPVTWARSREGDPHPMEMIGQSVTHKTLGIGTVENVNGRYLSIRFGAALKTFVYPDTFGKFLTANDPAFAAQIERDLDAGRNEKAKNEARRREEARYFSQGIVIPGRRQSEEETQSPYVKEEEESDF